MFASVISRPLGPTTETKAKSLAKESGVFSLLRKSQLNLRVSPRLAVTVCFRADPLITGPLPSPLREPEAKPRNDSRLAAATEGPVVFVSNAWKLPPAGAIPNDDVWMLASPTVEYPLKAPVSKPPLMKSALDWDRGPPARPIATNKPTETALASPGMMCSVRRGPPNHVVGRRVAPIPL